MENPLMKTGLAFGATRPAAPFLATALLLLVSGGEGCAPAPPSHPAAEQVLRVRMREDPPDIDPAQSGDTLSDRLNLEVHDGLVDFEPDTLRLIPAVADSWTISSDGLRYTFQLHPGVRFHNGRALTSADVLYSFTRILDPRVNSKRREIFADVEGAAEFTAGRSPSVKGLEAPDPLTFRITLSKPLPYFLQLLATPAAAVVPREVYEDPAKGFLTHPVGCGPFKFVRWERSNFMELSAFGDYYRGRPKLDRVVIRFIENPASAMEEYKAGGLEWMDEMPGSETDIARLYPGDYRKGPYLATYYYGMNLARKPFQGNPELRKAFNYAVDRKAICDQLFEGTHTVSRGILPPGTPGFNPDLKGFDFDPEKAKEHLAKAGYPGGRGLPMIDLWVNNNEKLLQIAQKVQADLRQVGIPVRIKAVDWANFLQAVQGTAETPGEALLYKFGWQADYPDPDAFLYWLLHSRNAGPAGNMGRYSNPKVDDLLDRARNLLRMEDRIPLYREAERIAVEEDAAWLFVSNFTERFLIKPYVKGVVLSPLGMSRTPFDRMWIEKSSSGEPATR
jgi:peptide/nickel transport system substrate-binding protein